MIQILNIKNIRMCSVNNKYIGRSFAISPDYRNFKKLIKALTKKIPCKPPYYFYVELKMYMDIDNPMKVIQDAMCEKLEINDRDILGVHIVKETQKRGLPGELRIWLDDEKQYFKMRNVSQHRGTDTPHVLSN